MARTKLVAVKKNKIHDIVAQRKIAVTKPIKIRPEVKRGEKTLKEIEKLTNSVRKSNLF